MEVEKNFFEKIENLMLFTWNFIKRGDLYGRFRII